VDLAEVLAELDCVTALDQPAEGTSGFELGQLAMIAHEHELAPRALDVVKQLGELTGRDHPPRQRQAPTGPEAG
jgi:hypothetical protein